MKSQRDQPRLGRGLSSLISPTTPPPGTSKVGHGIGASGAVSPPSEPPATAGFESATKQNSPGQTDQAPRTARIEQGGLQVANGPRLQEIPISQIGPNPMQPRRNFDPARLKALAESLSRDGALQPVIVRPAATGYELVAGERRWRAARLAGLATLPAIVRDVDARTQFELALVENLQREDLNPVERARAYQELASRHQLTHEQIAERVGEDRSNISNYIRILDLDDDTLDRLADRSLSMGHARSLLAVGDAALRRQLARRIIAEQWSVRQIEAVVRGEGGRKREAAQTKQRPNVADWERRLSEAIGLRVRIRESRRRNSGRIIIEYQSVDDFDRVTTRLGVGEGS